MKILLIDDDEWIRDSMSIFFESEGCYLLALETAEEGIEELKKEVYDIIIVDYRLPGMDGLEFLRQIQELHPDTMRILITAYGSRELVSEGERNVMLVFLVDGLGTLWVDNVRVEEVTE